MTDKQSKSQYGDKSDLEFSLQHVWAQSNTSGAKKGSLVCLRKQSRHDFNHQRRLLLSSTQQQQQNNTRGSNC